MTRSMRRFWVAVLAAVLAVAAAGPLAGAQAASDQGAVTFTILGIRATNEAKEHIDPALAAIADELRRSKFNSFRLVVSDTRGVPMQGTWELPLAEGYAVRVQPERESGDNVKYVLTWLGGDKAAGRSREIMRVPMEIRKGKYFLTGGWKLKEGALLAAIAAK